MRCALFAARSSQKRRRKSIAALPDACSVKNTDYMVRFGGGSALAIDEIETSSGIQLSGLAMLSVSESIAFDWNSLLLFFKAEPQRKCSHTP